MFSSTVTRRVSFVCAAAAAMACATIVPVSSVPAPATQLQSPQKQDVGLGTVLWSVVDGCFDTELTDPIAVCLKSKALTALDRALAKPTVTIVEGLSLASRAGKSLTDHQSTEKADRAALDAAKDPDHKSALLDDMLVNRIDMLMSTKNIVFDGLASQEGRGRKKEQKAMQMAMMMAGMTAVAVMGPLTFSFIALLAAKALLISKIALIMSGIVALKKLLQPQHSGHEAEAVQVSSHHYGRTLNLDAQDMAYSGQKQ